MKMTAVILGNPLEMEEQLQTLRSFAEKNPLKDADTTLLAFPTQTQTHGKQWPINEKWQKILYQTEAPHNDDALLDCLSRKIGGSLPDLVIFPGSLRCRQLAVRLSLRLQIPVHTNIHTLIQGDRGLMFKRDVYLGKMAETLQSMGNAPIIISTISGGSSESLTGGNEPPWEWARYASSKPEYLLSAEYHMTTADSSWSTAQRMIILGGGIAPGDMDTIRALSQKLQAEIAGTRSAVENGRVPLERMVGISGRSVAPQCCLILAASGMTAFVKGIEASRTIIAVNTDSCAPIFKVADYGIVSDYRQFLETMLEDRG